MHPLRASGNQPRLAGRPWAGLYPRTMAGEGGVVLRFVAWDVAEGLMYGMAGPEGRRERGDTWRERWRAAYRKIVARSQVAQFFGSVACGNVGAVCTVSECVRCAWPRRQGPSRWHRRGRGWCIVTGGFPLGAVRGSAAVVVCTCAPLSRRRFPNADAACA